MDNPRDRVTYQDLKLVRSEFEELMRLSVEAHILKRPVSYEKYVDESFTRNVNPVSISLPK